MARQRKKTKKKLLSTGNLMAIFIVLIMVTSILGFMYGGPSGSQGGFTYQEMDFGYNQEGMLIMQTEDGPTLMYYPPESILLNPAYNVSEGFTQLVMQKKLLYITYPPEDEFKENIAGVQFELKNMLEERFAVSVFNAFTGQNQFNLPIMECKDAGESEAIIQIMSGNTTKMNFDDNCLEIQVSQVSDLLRIRDSIVYSLYGLKG